MLLEEYVKNSDPDEDGQGHSLTNLCNMAG